jgi:predicted DNA-binding transcriptional regulator AlpA
MRNLWFEHIVDAYLAACAARVDWVAACAAAEQAHGARPRTLLTQPDLKHKKGIPYSRQHIDRKIKAGAFPPPFNMQPGYASARKKRSDPTGISTIAEQLV